MGYRSDVGIIIERNNPDNPTIPEVLAMAKVKGILSDNYFTEYWDTNEYGWDDRSFYFWTSYVKWCEDYQAVKSIVDLFSFFDKLGFDGKLVRLGEDYEDVDVKIINDGEDLGVQMERVSRVFISIEDPDGILGNQKEK